MTTIGRELRDGVREAYSSAAEAPDAQHPFPVGAAFAREVGYGTAQAFARAFSRVEGASPAEFRRRMRD